MIELVDLRKSDISALNKELKSAELACSKLKILVSIWKEKAVHKLSIAKKYIARIKTILNEKLNNKS